MGRAIYGKAAFLDISSILPIAKIILLRWVLLAVNVFVYARLGPLVVPGNEACVTCTFPVRRIVIAATPCSHFPSFASSFLMTSLYPPLGR